MRCKELDIFKILGVLEFFCISFGFFGIFFGEFFGFLLEVFGFFFLEFFGNSFGIFWEYLGNSLGDSSAEMNRIFEYERNLCFCQDFGVRQTEGRRILILRSASASISHLKI